MLVLQFTLPHLFLEKLLILETRKLRGYLINASKYIKVRSQTDGTRFFSTVPSGRTRCNGQKLQHRNFYLNMKLRSYRAVEQVA